MNQIEQRLARLEKSLRYYRLFFGTTVIALFAVILMSSGKKTDVPDLVKAKAFQVVDDDGNVLCLLNKEKGNGSLATYSSNGTKLIQLFTSTGGAGAINTFAGNGKLNFKVTQITDGGGYMALYNSDQKEVMEAGSIIGNAGYLQVNDHNGDKIAWVTEVKNGGGSLSLFNANLGTIFLEAQDVGGRVSIYNKGNTRIGYLGTQDSQDGNLSVYSSSNVRLGGVPVNY